ncbi:DUF2490 domain-containing protein [Sphingobacterium alkalisoli]|uniref:DUF2490 domain-containing protein n=1 Tax=Sphingobacterium alkalisoli TaxID=1874115 RepID=A0A4U0GZP8_9SPHI|nr:DUF2490 domain-containing protein [Sphingobacterium alkalisoli]TJY64576.1 DUF2490 domain-containing protein [Sphingobacterium alkalisoli]GGH20889.1 hypothetical protein GCM10011418_26410 [Sphingobacterium alkalisoli]
MKFIFTCVFLFFSISTLFAQQQAQGWLIYFGNTAFKSSPLSIHHELQLRDYQLGGDHNQTLLRVGLEYAAKPWLSITGGYGFIYTEAENSPNNPFNEHRIYQEALLKHGVNRFSIRHRFRLEERFIADKSFRGRGRYGLFVDVPLTKADLGKDAVYMAVYNEIFLNISEDDNLDIFDRNRLYGGIGYKVTNDLGIQLGYMLQHVEQKAGTNHVLLSLHHRMKW